MRWSKALLLLILGFSIAYPQFDASAARRGKKAVAAKAKKKKAKKVKRGGGRRQVRVVRRGGGGGGRRNNGGGGGGGNNAAPAVPKANGLVAPRFSLNGSDHNGGGSFSNPVEIFGNGGSNGPVARPVAEASGVSRLKPLVKNEPGADANDPCGIRFAAPTSDEFAVALFSEGFYFDRRSQTCEKGFRGSGGNPFPFRSQEECSKAVAAGGCSLKDSDPPLKRGKVVGQAVQISGDRMPSAGPQDRDGTATKPLATRIHIFQGGLSQEGGPFQGIIRDKSPFLVVTSDKSGNFAANLPPGQYTMFAEVDGKLVHTDGAFPRDGNQWSTVNVEEGETTSANIVDSRGVTQ